MEIGVKEKVTTGGTGEIIQSKKKVQASCKKTAVVGKR